VQPLDGVSRVRRRQVRVALDHLERRSPAVFLDGPRVRPGWTQPSELDDGAALHLRHRGRDQRRDGRLVRTGREDQQRREAATALCSSSS